MTSNTEVVDPTMHGHDDDHDDAIKFGRATYKQGSSTHERENLGCCAAEESSESQHSDRTSERTCDEDIARLYKCLHKAEIRLYQIEKVLNMHAGGESGDKQGYRKSIRSNPSHGAGTPSIDQSTANDNHAEGSIDAIGAASMQVEPSTKSPDTALKEYNHQLELLLQKKDRLSTTKRGMAESSKSADRKRRRPSSDDVMGPMKERKA